MKNNIQGKGYNKGDKYEDKITIPEYTEMHRKIAESIVPLVISFNNLFCHFMNNLSLMR